LGYVLVQFLLFFVLYRACVTAGPRLFELSPPLTILAALLGGASALIGLAAFAAIGSSFRIRPEPRPIVLLSTMLFLLKGTLLAGVAAAAVIAFHFLKAHREETLLLGRYPGYAEYRAKTWGIIPGFPSKRQER
jgi:protein-S-isoprenylcysteine O-methyltransferase Ste14